jgi:hypothetical protein
VPVFTSTRLIRSGTGHHHDTVLGGHEVLVLEIDPHHPARVVPVLDAEHPRYLLDQAR